MAFPLEGGEVLILNIEEGAVLFAEIITPFITHKLCLEKQRWFLSFFFFFFHFYLNVCSNGRTKDKPWNISRSK